MRTDYGFHILKLIDKKTFHALRRAVVSCPRKCVATAAQHHEDVFLNQLKKE